MRRLLLHCQHALGLGHLARSLALANGLRHHFEVTLLNGGRFPAGTAVPDGVQVVNLDPLGHDADYSLVSHDPELTVEQAMVRRRAAVLAELERVDPHVLLVEMFPFGRKKFRFELEPLLEAAHAPGPRARPRVVCSLRDILVNQRRDQAGHDERAAQLANRWFDLVLVHADPAFATLEESFRPATPLQVPVRYTGFVTAADGAPVAGRATSTGCWCRPVAAWPAGRCCGGPRRHRPWPIAPVSAPRWWPGRSCPTATGPPPGRGRRRAGPHRRRPGARPGRRDRPARRCPSASAAAPPWTALPGPPTRPGRPLRRRPGGRAAEAGRRPWPASAWCGRWSRTTSPVDRLVAGN
ncbi:MAG: hypothetical protein R2761_05335 [Acidimicrobiales bacterium]